MAAICREINKRKAGIKNKRATNVLLLIFRMQSCGFLNQTFVLSLDLPTLT